MVFVKKSYQPLLPARQHRNAALDFLIQRYGYGGAQGQQHIYAAAKLYKTHFVVLLHLHAGLKVVYNAACYGAGYLLYQQVLALRAVHHTVALVLGAAFGIPGYQKLAGVVLAVHYRSGYRVAVDVHIERAHKNAYLQAGAVEVLVVVGLLYHYYFTIGGANNGIGIVGMLAGGYSKKRNDKQPRTKSKNEHQQRQQRQTTAQKPNGQRIETTKNKCGNGNGRVSFFVYGHKNNGGERLGKRGNWGGGVGCENRLLWVMQPLQCAPEAKNWPDVRGTNLCDRWRGCVRDWNGNPFWASCRAISLATYGPKRLEWKARPAGAIWRDTPQKQTCHLYWRLLKKSEIRPQHGGGQQHAVEAV